MCLLLAMFSTAACFAGGHFPGQVPERDGGSKSEGVPGTCGRQAGQLHAKME